jgi:hypothetical protein
MNSLNAVPLTVTFTSTLALSKKPVATANAPPKLKLSDTSIGSVAPSKTDEVEVKVTVSVKLAIA